MFIQALYFVDVHKLLVNLKLASNTFLQSPGIKKSVIIDVLFQSKLMPELF